MISRNRRLPGETAWLVCERRASGERKHYLSNHVEDITLESLAAPIKPRWVCEQMHQQMKEEIGLDHFEGRSWGGLHHHALMTMIAFAVLQHLRLGGKNHHQPGPPPSPSLPQVRRRLVATLSAFARLCPHCRKPAPYHLRP